MKPTRFELAVLLISATLIGYQILIPPLIGLADNGDFERFLPQNGLAHVSIRYQDKYFQFFNSKYRIIPKTPYSTGYVSSTAPLIRGARWLSIRAGASEYFDIRVLSSIYALLVLCGFWLVMVVARSLSSTIRFILAGMLILTFTDAGYVAYFNSFYSEGTALSFLLVAVGCYLLLASGRTSSPLCLVAYFLAAGIVVVSKPMYVPLAPPFALLGLYASKHLTLRKRYWLSAALALAVCSGAVWYQFQTPRILRAGAVYVEVFMDLLPNSSTPREDLAALGLNPDFAVFSGTTPYQDDSPMLNPLFLEEFSASVSNWTIPLFYLTHPGRLYSLCVRCVKHVFSTRLDHLGYYEASAEKPAGARPLGIWSVLRETVVPRSVFFLAVFFATGVVAIVYAIRSHSTTQRALYLLYSFFVFIAVTQFFVSLVAGGGEPDLAKHLFLFNVAFDGCVILSIAGFGHWFDLAFRRRSTRESSVQYHE